MNKIFRTLWNAERHQQVVVNETTGSAQSRGTGVHQTMTARSEANRQFSHVSVGKLATAVAAALTISVSSSVFADVHLYGWDHYTGTNDWSSDLSAANYGNDSSTLTVDSHLSFDNMAIGRRSGSHIYGGDIAASGEGVHYGWVAAPSSYLTAGGNLNINSNGSVDVRNNFWLFGTEHVDRTTNDHDGHDDHGGFGQDIVMIGGRLSIGGTLDVGSYNAGNPNGHCIYYEDWNQIQMSSGATLTTGDIEGVAKFTLKGGSKLTSSGDLGSIRNDPMNYNNSEYYVYGSTVDVQNFNSNAFVNAYEGSTIVATNIDLTSKTYTSSNSTLNTTLDQITDYNNSIEHTRAINLANEAVATLDASALGRYDNLSRLLSNFVNNVSWSGGTFDFSGTYTQAIADKATQLIHNQWGSGVNVEFEKVIATPEPVDYSNGLTAAIVNSIHDENSLSAGAVFLEHKLDARNNAVTIGGQAGANTIDLSTGFVGINGSQTTTVTGGKTLVLLGNGGNSVISSGIVAADNGTLRLGTANSGVTVGGTVVDVDLSNNGQLISQRGTFIVGDMSGKGSLSVQSGTLTVNALEITGSVTNASVLTLGDGAAWSGGSNSGTLTTSGADIGGSFSNNGGTWHLGDRLTFADDAQLANGTGTIRTDFTNLFDKGTGAEINPLNTISLSAAKPEAVRVIKTELFTQYLKPEVLDAVKDHMTFDGAGHLIITNTQLTTTQRDDLLNAFKEAFGTSTTVTFTGKIEGTSENSILNVAKVNQLQNAGFTGLIYFDRELEGENGTVSVGGGIGESVGFMGINDATGDITVENGKELVLVGKAGSDGDSYKLTDGQNIQVSSGTLTLGSLGLENSADYSGTTAGVTAAGSGSRVRVAAGDYTVASLILNSGASLQNNAGLTIEGNAEGTSNATITNNADLTVQGQVSMNGTLENKGTMDVRNGISINGQLTNYAGKTLEVTGETLVTSTGSGFINAGTATLNGDLRVNGILTNSAGGMLNTNQMVVTGSLNNFGQIKASDTSEVYGTLTNTGTINLYEQDAVVGSSGRLDNTGLSHSITGSGTITVNGLLTNVNNADFDGGTLKLTTEEAGQAEGVSTLAGVTPQVINGSTMTFNEIIVGAGTEFWNTGTVTAETGSVEDGGYVVNGRQPPSSTSGASMMLMALSDGVMPLADPQPRATTAYRSYTVGGQLTNAGDAYYGTLKITGTGTLTNSADGALYTGESQQWVDGTGITIEAGGQLINAGTAVLASSMNNAGTIRGDGTITLQHGGTGTNEFINTGTIDVGVLTTSGTVNYKQTAGSLTAASTNLTNSTFTIEGGSFDVASVGTGNTYTFGKAGADESVNVQASVGTVTSDNTYNILEGAVFDGRDLQLTSDQKTVHLLGGRFETTLDQIFGDIDYTALDIDAGSPDDLVDVEGVKVATGVGDVLESIEQGIEFGWGTVAFDDAVYSASVASDVLQKLDDIDIDTVGHEHQLEVAFNGQASQTFTVDLANQVKARPHGTDDAFGSAYAVFAGEMLTNVTNAGQGNTALYVGRSDTTGLTGTNILDNNIGFKGVEGASDGMTVADGRHFVLVGELQSAQNASDFEILDGALTVKSEGLVTLGTYGTEEATAGLLHDVTLADGTLRVRHGSFSAENVKAGDGSHLYIGGDGEQHGGDTLRADTTSALSVASYEAGDGSEVLNWGAFSADSLTTALGASTGGSIVNYGTLDVGSADIATAIDNFKTAEFDSLTLNGQTITNEAGASFHAAVFALGENGVIQNKADASWTSDTTSLDGNFVNASGAESDFGALTLTANGTLDNDGIAEADSLKMTGGQLINDGTVTLHALNESSAAGDIVNAGTFQIEDGTGSVTIAAGGSFENTGKFTAQREVSLTGGTFTQSSDTAAQFTNLAISGSAGGLVVDAGKTAQGSGELTVAMTGTAAGVQNAGTVHFANTTITSGAVTGEGTMVSDNGFTVKADGSVSQNKVETNVLTNAGTVSLDELVLASGTNSGTLTLADSMTGGSLENSGTLNLAGENGFTFTGKITNAANGTIEASEKVTVDTGADLVLNQGTGGSASFDAGLDVVNKGHMSVDAESTASGSVLTVKADAADVDSVENNGVISFETISIEQGKVIGTGTLGTADSMITTAANAAVSQGKVEATTLGNAGTINTEHLIVHTMGSNTGSITADNADFDGSFLNDASGTLTLADSLTGSISNLGTVTIEGSNSFTFDAGVLTNLGSLTATETVTLEGGTIDQQSDKTASFTDLTINSGALIVEADKAAEGEDLLVNAAEGVQNKGTLSFNNVTVSEKGSITGAGSLTASDTTEVKAGGSIAQTSVTTGTLTNAGTVTADELTLTTGTNSGTLTLADSMTGGSLENSGTLNLAGENGFTFTGKITNAANGTIEASEKVTVDTGADLVLNQGTGGSASFDAGLDVVNKGHMSVDAESTASGSALTVTADAADTVSADNEGAINFDNVQVNQGTVQGSGTILGDNFTVAEKGAVNQGTITAGVFENAGTIDAGNLTVIESGTNTGTVTAANADLKDFTNESEGIFNLEDSLAGSLTSDGTVTIAGGADGFTLTGTLINQNAGKLTAEETLTIAGGHLIQKSQIAAEFQDVTVNAGDFQIADGKTASGGVLTVNASEGVKNDGTAVFDEVTVADGASVIGTGTLGDGKGSLTVAGTGSVTQNKVNVADLQNAGTIIANVSADHGQNSGTITAGDLTITGQSGTLVNTGMITSSGQAAVAGIDNQKEIIFGNGATLMGTNANTGTIVSNGGLLQIASGTTTTSGTGSLTANAGMNVDGRYEAAAGTSTTVTGGLTIAHDGQFSTAGTTVIDKVSNSAGELIAAGGDLHIGDLTDAEGMTFTQTADTNYTFDKGWFENSTINIQGGHFDASVIKDDAGNASGMLGQNTVNISGSDPLQFEAGFDEKPSADKQDWSDPYVVVNVDKVNADTIINIGSGGVLDVGTIDLTEGAHQGEQTITVGANGAIQTSLDQFFDHVATTVIDINAVDPETGKVDIITDVIATTTVTDVKDEIASGIGFENGGMVVWDDEDWSIPLVTSVLDSLASAGMISEDKQVEQHFLGDFMGDFTIDTASALKEEQEKLENSWVLDPGVVFDTTTLHNNSVAAGDANKGLVIGGEAQTGENQIDYSIGFQDVANADYVRVEGGKEFALVGTARPDDFDWTTGYDDSNQLLIDAADGGSLDAQNGTITLGSNGVDTPTVGWVNSASVAEDSSLVTKNGEFAVWEITNEGTVSVTDGSILHTNSIDNEFGAVQVSGELTADRLQNNNGSLTISETGKAEIGEMTSSTVDAVIDNAGSLTISTVTNNVLAGSVTNAETGSLIVNDDFAFTGTLVNDGEGHYQDVTIELGTWTNNGFEEGGVLDVAEDGTWTNNGTAVWDQMTVAGEASNTSLEEGEGLKVGTDAEGDAFTIAGTGSFINSGRLDATEADTTYVDGSLSNSGLAGYNDMTIGDGGSSYNEGYEEGHKLTVADGGVHTNAGTSVWDEVKIEQGGKDVIGSDADNETLFQISGNYDNFGTVDATKAEGVTVVGTLTNEEGAQAKWDDLTIAGWLDEDGETVHEALVTNDGTETGDHLTIAAGGTHVVTGESTWNSITVDAGGTDRYGSDADSESFTIGGIYVNNGTLDAAKAEDMVFTGSVTNNGTAGYQDLTIQANGSSVNTGYEKGEDLVIVADGSHENSGTSIWNTVKVEEGGHASNTATAEDSGMKVGSDAADEFFVIAGTFDNSGNLDASDAELTTVSGILTNAAEGGQALYDDMTITEGGLSQNAGYEKGDILTVEGDHTNTGTSIWNNASVGENGSMTNGEELVADAPKGNEEGFTSDAVELVGSDAADETFDVAGDLTNHGILDASKSETTDVSGAVTNDGQAKYDDMTIDAGGTSVNDGLEQGDILTVEDGTHVNTGTSIWNNAAVGENGSMTNGEELVADAPKGNEEGFTSDAVELVGSDAPDEVFDIAGDLTNHGILDASKSETTDVSGNVTNDGQAKYDDMTIAAGGTSKNDGYEQGDILTVEGEHTNTGTSIWNNAAVSEDGSMTNGEELAADAPKGDAEGFTSDAVELVGSDAPDEVFDIAGDLTNHGILDASKSETTDVSGTVTNDGQAWYDDMTVDLDGTSKNDGYEQGDILTVEGEHTNTGTSIWNNVTVAEGGHGQNGEELAPDAPKGHEDGFESDSTVVIGSAEPDEEFNVDGTYDNHGKLDASETENTNVSGDLTNDGQAEYDDMTVADGGHSQNDGYEHGHDLTIEEGGSHENTGVSIWDNVNVAGSDTNTGDQTIGGEGGGDEFIIGPNGDYTNEGSLDATESENTRVDGDITNNGDAHYDDMDVNDGGHSTNNDYEEGDILDVNNGGEWENNGESHWNNVNINQGGSGSNSGDLTVDDTLHIGGDFDNTGSIDADKVKVDDGVLDLGDGSITADETIVNGGDIIVGNHKPIADENRVDYDTSINGTVNGHWWVIGNGDLSFGPGGDELADTIGAPDIPETNNRLTVTQNITIGETGGIAVGSDLWTDKDNHLDVGDGNLYFGSDSLTVIDSSILEGGKAAFTGSKDGATVTVEDGAKLVLGNLTVAGDYVITSGFQTSGNVDQTGWIGGWTSDALWAPTDAGSGLDWVLTLEWDDTKVWVNAVLENVLNKYPDISIPGNINDSLEHCKDAGGPDQVLACTVIRNPDLSDAEKTKIINSVAEIGYAAGAMAMAFNEATMTADSIESRLSMKGEAFNRDGSMKTSPNGHGLWVDILGTWTKADSYGVTGGADVGYDADSYGFIMGADHKLEGKNVILGGAFSYTDGSLDSTGDLLKTSNAFTTYGIHGYAAWKPTEKTNLVGTVSVMRSSSEAVQGLPAAAGFSKAEADIDTTMFALGVRGEHSFSVGQAQIIPHAGLRMVVADTAGYDTKLDGQRAYKNEADTTTTFQMPIGIAFRYDHQTESGWTIRPTADFSIIPQFGDTEQDTKVTGTGGATDTVTGDFAGNYAASIQLGIQAETKDNMTFGLKYGYTGGEQGRKDQAVRIEFRKLF